MKKLQILLIGNGKLGQAIYAYSLNHSKFHEPIVITKKQSFPLQRKIDCIVDASIAGAINEYLPDIQRSKTPLVIGTTGQTQNDLSIIQGASNSIPLMLCENFCEGVFLLRKALTSLKTTKSAYHINETHHTDKKDSPSGTAKLIQRTLKKKCPIYSKRIKNEIGYHSVTLQLENEVLKFSHQALSRDIFAAGALKACLFLVSQKPGLYSHYL